MRKTEIKVDLSHISFFNIVSYLIYSNLISCFFWSKTRWSWISFNHNGAYSS